MIGINKIYALGVHSIGGATIYSNGNGQILNVYTAAQVSSGFDIYCLGNDTCKVYCDHLNGCVSATLHCYKDAQCSVACSFDFQNQRCASVTVYNQTYNKTLPSIPTVSTLPTTSTSVNMTTSPVTPNTTTINATNTVTYNYYNTPKDTTRSGHDTTNTKTTVATSGISVNTIDNSNDETSKNPQIEETLESLLVWTMIFIVTIALVSVFCIWIYHNFVNYKKGCDQPTYSSILFVSRNVADFYSDAIFCLYLAIVKKFYILFVLSSIFTLIPHFVSNTMGFIMIKKFETSNYNQYQLQRQYIKRFDIFLLIMSMFGGFYAATELASSNIFYWDMFSLKLAQKETVALHKYRFYNIVLFENCFQVIIQISYISMANSFSIYVFITMFFTIASLLIGIFQYCSQITKQNSKLGIKFYHRQRQLYLMHVVSKYKGQKNLGMKCYQYTYQLFHDKLSSILNVDSQNIIVDTIKTNKNKNGILIRFEINDYDLKRNQFRDACNDVMSLADSSLHIGRQFQVDIRNGLGFTKRQKIVVEKVELIQENIKNIHGNLRIPLQSASVL